MLHAIYSPFYRRILEKFIIFSFSGFKTPYKKISKTRKLESIHEQRLVERKWVENQTKTRVSEYSSLCPETSTKNAV
jgi:hypothetical protein